tara:strand:+ start:4347 stop:4976 length:630 start_codon:yes stop_codon:yes gene_type:complete
MKVIFLDIDGVMNSHVFYEKRYKSLAHIIKRKLNVIKSRIKKLFYGVDYYKKNNYSNEKSYTYEYQLKRLKESTCKDKWEWLTEFCNENDIKICISSVWKNHFGGKNGRQPEWWDKALVDLGFNEGTFVGLTGQRRTERGTEIQEWLDLIDDVEDYAILDDDSDMLEHQFVKFHHCDGWFGLSPNHLYRIKRQFDGKSEYSKLSKAIKN